MLQKLTHQKFPSLPIFIYTPSNLGALVHSMPCRCVKKHKLNIRAPTRINPINHFGETMFRYTRAHSRESAHKVLAHGSIHPCPP